MDAHGQLLLTFDEPMKTNLLLTTLVLSNADGSASYTLSGGAVSWDAQYLVFTIDLSLNDLNALKQVL